MNSILDILLPLANAGACGICIFGVYTTGGLISRAADKPKSDPALYRSINTYMAMCIVMAVISAVSGIYNAAYNQSRVASSEQKVTALQTTVNDKANALLVANDKLNALTTNLGGQSVDDLKKQLVEVQKQLSESQAQLLMEKDILQGTKPAQGK